METPFKLTFIYLSYSRKWVNSILCNYNPNSPLSLVPKITTTKIGSLDGCSFPFLMFLRKNVKKDVISNKKTSRIFMKGQFSTFLTFFLDVFCAIKRQVRCIFSWRFLNIKKYLIIFWRLKNVKNVHEFNINVNNI